MRILGFTWNGDGWETRKQPRSRIDIERWTWTFSVTLELLISENLTRCVALSQHVNAFRRSVSVAAVTYIHLNNWIPTVELESPPIFCTLDLHCFFAQNMADNQSYQKQRLPKTGRVYRDWIHLEEDFEVLRVRTASRSGPNNIAVETGRTSIPLPWTVGSSWAPEDNLEFSLDPDDEWYNEALEADIVNTEDKDVVIHEKKKKWSQASVCCVLGLTYFSALMHIWRLGPTSIGRYMHKTPI